jgi:hypothetical protein
MFKKWFLYLSTLVLALIFATNASATSTYFGARDASETEKGVVELATDAESLALTATDKVVTPANLGAAGGIDERIAYLEARQLSYGVSWNESTDSYTRLGSLAGYATSQSPGDDLLEIQSEMKRCILDSSGDVVYYLDSDNSYNRLGVDPSVTGTDDAGTASKLSDTGVFTSAESEYLGKYVHNTTDDTYALITAKDSDDVLSIDTDIMANGEAFAICTAVLDGSVGNVMVEIPKFYYRYSYASNTHSWEVSTVALPNFDVHPAFIKAGVEVDYRYMGAFEGYQTGSVLYSRAGVVPTTSTGRQDFRTYAEAAGTGYHQQDFYLTSAVQLLYLIEYADFDSQAMIGTGNTAYTVWDTTECRAKTGLSILDGNATDGSNTTVNTLLVDGSDTNGEDVFEYMTYRGIENLYGSVYQWVDGINIYQHSSVSGQQVWVSGDWTDFDDDTSTDYENIGTAPASSGYVASLIQALDGFYPASVGGSAGSSTYVCDYFYANADADIGWRACLVGGSACYGVRAGAFFWLSNYEFSSSSPHFGGRLCF